MSIKLTNLPRSASNDSAHYTDPNRKVSAGSIKINNTAFENYGTEKPQNMMVAEYELENQPEPVTNPLNHFKGYCRMPSWLVFLIANAVVLVAIVSLGTVLGLALTKTSTGGTCTQNSDCDTSVGLICSGGKCTCSADKYWDLVSYTCKIKKNLNGTCSSSTQCDDRISLSCVNSSSAGSGICSCASNLFWNGSQCIVLSGSINGQCYPNLKPTGCNSALDLYCDNSTSKCICPSTKFWSGSTCLTYRIYLEACLTNAYCLASGNLACQTQGPNSGLCDCATKRYWDGSQCANVRSFNQSCTLNQQCDTSAYLSCPTSGTMSGKCNCQSNKFWNGTLCLSKLSINATCTSNSSCDNTLLLYCSSNRCVCSSMHYWDTYSLSCLPKKVVSGGCSSSILCDSSANLVCSGSGSTVGSCSCPTTSFWNVTACQPKLTWKVPCASFVQCNDFVSLTCTNTSQFSTSWICDCNSYLLYFDGSLCTSKKTNQALCGTSYECQDYNLLYCSAGRCICPSTHYWDGNTCSQKKLYTVPCLTNTECDNFRFLICPTTIGGCDCPYLSTGYWCDCNATSFWNSTATTCQTRNSYQQPCPFGNYQCVTLNTGLSCTNNICDCPPAANNWFWNSKMCKQCPGTWQVMGQYCYYSTPFSTDWNTADQYCKTFGGLLLVISDQTEFNAIQTNLQSFMAVGSSENIGLTAQASPGNWVWSTGVSFSTSSPWWCPGNPVSGAGNCAVIKRTGTNTFCIENTICATSTTAPSLCEVQ